MEIVKKRQVEKKARASKYGDIIEALSAMKADEVLVIEVPKGEDSGAYRTKLSDAIRYHFEDPLKFYVTSDGRVGIEWR